MLYTGITHWCIIIVCHAHAIINILQALTVLTCAVHADTHSKHCFLNTENCHRYIVHNTVQAAILNRLIHKS